MPEESRSTVPICCLLLAGLVAPPVLGQVADLSVRESEEAVVLQWESGAAPYRVLRSASPDFYFGNRVVADALAVPGVEDDGAARPGNHSWFYDVVTDGESDPAGFASNPPPADVVYFLDGRGNTVRRIVRNALAHDLSYGDQPFTFNRPSGARFDGAGNLYLTSTTAVHRIRPGETAVDLVATGFTAAAGLDLVEMGEETLLAVADEGTGTVWLVDAGSGAKIQAETGLAGPVGVAFSDDPLFGRTGLYVAEPTRILRLPDPRMVFVPQVDQRILLSKAWSFDVYPSPDQVADGEIRVQVRLSPVVDPTGKSAFFRLADPRDPSPYVDQAGIADNRPLSPAGTVTQQASFDVDGMATAILAVDNQHSGNNYRVEAGLAGGGDFRTLATSPVYTTWRRTYIEHDFMWRSGSWIVADSGAGEPNPSRVWVADSSGFQVGDDVHVLSGASAETATGEFGLVAALGPGYVDVDTSFGAGGAGLQYRYESAVAPPPDDQRPYSFIARIASGVFDSSPDTASIRLAFDDAFAEWTVLPTGGFVPNWPVVPKVGLDPEYVDLRSPAFFNANLISDKPSILNTIHLVSAAGSDGFLGLTQPRINNWSWIFNEEIASAFPGASAAAQASVTAHELAHQFSVNRTDQQGHDAEEEWPRSGRGCLMNVLRDRTLGVVKMHAPAGAPTQDLMCIRTHVDDLDNSIFCSEP